MRTFRHETALYLLALLLALALRLIALGGLPLTDPEARWALQALGVAQGTHPALGSQPAYVLPTAVLFFVYGGATNSLARLISALAGSGLVLVPWLFRDRLKPRTALLLAFLLAVEPGLVALSRQAGSSILAVTFTVAAWGLWDRRKTPWAGICAGLALLSGAPLWSGLLTFGLTWAIWQAMGRRPRPQAAQRSEPAVDEVQARNECSAPADWRTALWFAAGTIVLGGTLFFLAPNGLSAWLSGLPEYVTGWTQPSGLSLGLMLFSLAAYQPLGLILMLVATVRGWLQRSRRVMALSLWMGVALLLAVFYPGHQMGDLAWMLIPFWALAAIELARSLNVHPAERSEVLGVTVLAFLILVFIWLDFLGLMKAPAPSDQAVLRTWLIFGSFFLLIVSLLLVAVGWSIRVARYGAAWGLIAALSLYSAGAVMAAAGLRNLPDSVDVWRAGGNLPESALLQTTVNQMSDWSLGEIHSQPVTIVAINSPALIWLLQGRTVEAQNSLSPSATSPMVITPNQDNPTLAAGYRGQGFVWRRMPLWNEAGFSDWLRWLPFHQMAQDSETVILWVRTDLFIDATAPKP